MPRRPRLVLPGVPIHLLQRGVDLQACFFDDADRRAYLDDLAKIAADVGCAIHAYVLVTNHVHLLLTPTSAEGPARLMNRRGRRHVRRINDLHRRTGTPWEGRFRSCVTGSEACVLACCRGRPARRDRPEKSRWIASRLVHVVHEVQEGPQPRRFREADRGRVVLVHLVAREKAA